MAKKKVLHVDDDVRILRTVARFLEDHGFSVFSTETPFIAPIIEREKPDVVVMDVDMPLLPGDRIVAILRSHDFSTLPVIFFSGKPATVLAAIAEKTVPSAWVMKDRGLPALLEKIHSFTRA